MLPGLASTTPRSISFFSTPRSRSPTLSPARPSSRSFRNASTPVTTLFFSLPNPTSATSSPTFTFPPSIRPPAPPPPGDAEHVLHRHQERLVDVPLGLRDVAVQRRVQLLHLGDRVLVALDRLHGAPPDHRS